ncbi:MAG: protoporphyrinogen oxidase [Betaproteobacteria bacterium]|nr:protoporphyrinogen oxidase [Betaproteobacteria bacterium]PWB60858.1 MAG: protoporphyrinogen oxidase [Betaproteobacteria bacterium]
MTAGINAMDTSPAALDALVVGAGVSGLATAFGLVRRGLQVEVLDAGRAPGGVIGTVKRDGALYETGPNSALDTTPLIGELIAAAGIASERLPASEISNTRFVVRDGRPIALPMSPGAFLATPLFSGLAKARLALEPLVRRQPAGEEEVIAHFVRRRLGREFLDYAIEPFVAGIYAGDPDRLSVPAAFPKLHALEQRYGSLILGAILGARERRKRAETAKNTAKSFSFRGGMQTLTDALARGVQRVTLGAKAVSLARLPDGSFAVTFDQGGTSFTRHARAVVLAVPAAEAARLAYPLAPDATRALQEIQYPPVTVVATAYRREDVAHALGGFGFLAPRVEGRAVLGTLFSSSMFEGRAPEGQVLLTNFVGGRRNPELASADDATLAGKVAAEHRALLGARAPALWNAIVRWPRAIPQYELGHLGRIAKVAEAEKAVPGLRFCANYRGGVSVGDCIANAHATAESLGAWLRAPVTAP